MGYVWASVCWRDPDVPEATTISCGAALACPNPGELLFRLWGLDSGGVWHALGTSCFTDPPVDSAVPTVTPGDVLNALRRVGLPALAVQVQPKGKTLVNFDTIFYAEPATVVRDLRLLGQSVHVEATPSEYAWHFGDGTSQTTVVAGGPYPDKSIVHRYAEAGTTVHPSVDVSYGGRFRANGGPWQSLGGVVRIAGAAIDLRVAEATAVLSGQHR